MTRLRSPLAGRAAGWIGGLCVVVWLVSCDRPQSTDVAGGAQTLGEPADSQEPDEPRRVFTSRLAGSWYPADEQELADEIDGHLSKVSHERLEDVCALILPHADYRSRVPRLPMASTNSGGVRSSASL